MPLVPAICPQCGGTIEVDNTREAGICKYCGTPFITEKAINNYTISNSIHINAPGNTINMVYNDGTRFDHYYTIKIEREYHLLKGCAITYTIEMDGKKYILQNGGSVSIQTNLKRIDIQVTKKADGIEKSFGQLIGQADGEDIIIETDVVLNKLPVFNIISCTNATISLS